MIYREREDSESTNPAPYLRINPEHRFERHSDFELERIIYGSWNKGRGLKEDGLMKKVCVLPLFILSADFLELGILKPINRPPTRRYRCPSKASCTISYRITTRLIYEPENCELLAPYPN